MAMNPADNSASRDGPMPSRDLPVRDLPVRDLPAFRAITGDDIGAALATGWADFRAAPLLSGLFGLVYAMIGAGLVGIAWATDWGLIAFPLLAGFFLVGPITAVGLYEISRRRQAGEPLSTWGVLGAMRRNPFQIALFGLLLVFACVFWLRLAYFIYALSFGLAPQPLWRLLPEMFSTARGLEFLLVGNLAGALMAGLIFAVSVVGVPHLLDREVDVVTAAAASVAAVAQSPLVWFGFGVLVVFVVGAGMALGFVGLVVALPVIGHATWHLYRRALIAG